LLKTCGGQLRVISATLILAQLGVRLSQVIYSHLNASTMKYSWTNSTVQLAIILMRRIINMFALFEVDFEGNVILSDCYAVLKEISISDSCKSD